jgi:hypothetical protein
MLELELKHLKVKRSEAHTPHLENLQINLTMSKTKTRGSLKKARKAQY